MYLKCVITFSQITTNQYRKNRQTAYLILHCMEMVIIVIIKFDAFHLGGKLPILNYLIKLSNCIESNHEGLTSTDRMVALLLF
jgi:hypothetical protein